MDKAVRALSDLSEIDDQLAGTKTVLDGLVPALEGRRAALREAIPAVFLDAYDALGRLRRRPVVVAVRSAHCSGCYLRLPPQLDSSIRRRQSLCLCPHCRRLLYMPPPAEEGEDLDEKHEPVNRDATDDRASKRVRQIGGRRSARQASPAASRREPGRKDTRRPGDARRASERRGHFGSADAVPGKAKPVKR